MQIDVENNQKKIYVIKIFQNSIISMPFGMVIFYPEKSWTLTSQPKLAPLDVILKPGKYTSIPDRYIGRVWADKMITENFFGLPHGYSLCIGVQAQSRQEGGVIKSCAQRGVIKKFLRALDNCSFEIFKL